MIAPPLPYFFWVAFGAFLIGAYINGMWGKEDKRHIVRLWYGIGLASFFLIAVVWLFYDRVDLLPARNLLFLVPLLGTLGAIPMTIWSIRTMESRIHGSQISFPKQDKRSLRISLVISMIVYIVVLNTPRDSLWLHSLLISGSVSLWLSHVALLLWVNKLERRTGRHLIERHEE